jgi:hypothetical protein
LRSPPSSICQRRLCLQCACAIGIADRGSVQQLLAFPSIPQGKSLRSGDAFVHYDNVSAVRIGQWGSALPPGKIAAPQRAEADWGDRALE